MQNEPTALSQRAPVFVVDGYGASINVEAAHLVIRDGFGRKAERRITRFARARSRLKRLVVRAPAGTISFSAIDWCHRLGIPIAVLGSDSRLISCHISTSESDGPLKRAQAIVAVTEDAIPIARALLIKKFKAQLQAVKVELPRLGLVELDSEQLFAADREISAAVANLDQDDNLAALLSREGYVARVYRNLLIGAALPWRDWTTNRIPQHWLSISPRDSGNKGKVRDATDPFNALLNYGYTLLEIEIRVACAQAGLEPDLGLLHVDSKLRESLIYDLEEPIRSQVDVLTLDFCKSAGLRPHMFHELREGIVRLDPDFARTYAEWLMPKLRTPSANVVGDFCAMVRKITIPYRLVDERNAIRKPGTRVGNGLPCGYCGIELKKTGLKFCSRHCYLRHSVEVAKPILKAQEKLANLRAQGLSPGHGGSAALKRGAAIAESNRRRSMGLTPDETRTRKAKLARERRRVRNSTLKNGLGENKI